MGIKIGNHQFAVKLIRRLLHLGLRAKGYTQDQATRLVGTLGDGHILAMIEQFATTWGPIILKIVLALLPFLLAAEPPQETPNAEFETSFNELMTVAEE